MFTDNDEWAEKFRWIRVHGQERKHHHPILGLNGRMDTLQAAILLAILDVFPEEVLNRMLIGEKYSKAFSGVDGLSFPTVPEHSTSVYAQYTILSEQREDIQKFLGKVGIPSVSYYSVPMHLQPVFSGLSYQIGDFPVTESVANTCLSLPMSPYLKEDDQFEVIENILRCIGDQ